MALQIEDPELVAEIQAESRKLGIPPEEVVGKAMVMKRARARERYDAIMKTLEEEVWPSIPSKRLGNPISKEEEEAMLGYGPGEY